VEERDIAGPVAELRREGAVRQTLDQLESAGVLTCYRGGTEPVWSIAPGSHLVAAFYRNGALHHLLNRAIVELALLGRLLGRRDRPVGGLRGPVRDARVPDPGPDAQRRCRPIVDSNIAGTV